MAHLRSIYKIILIIIGAIILGRIISMADSKHHWYGDETPAFLEKISDKAEDYIDRAYTDIYLNGGDGTGDDTGVIEGITNTTDKIQKGAGEILDAAGNIINDNGSSLMETASGIFSSARGLLEEAIKVLQKAYPDLGIDLPEISAPTVTPDPNYIYSSIPGLTVEVVDVGQADCILIYNGSDAMIIDAGNNEDGPLLVDYLHSLGITHLDYVVGTHAHEDHIGGLDDIIRSFDVDTIILPVVSNDTSTYASVIAATERSDAETVYASENASFTLGGASFSILACEPVVDETNINESSIVIRLDYDDASFLFTGDAEKVNEQDMLSRGVDVDCDVLKVGHHGSYTSSSSEFLAAVSPAISVVSCGTDNDYGHPHEVTMEALDNANAAIFRTDLSGTVRINTDGQTYEVSTVATNTNGAED